VEPSPAVQAAHSLTLTRALRLPLPGAGHSPPIMAFTGAGGKSTALFRLARELLAGQPGKPGYPAVIVSASTHLFLAQAQSGDRHWAVNPGQAGEDWLPSELPTGLTVVTGPPVEDERTQGLTLPALERLAQQAQDWGAPLLLEADGSRRLPLKAPADHEPALPHWVDQVVVTAGLWALGQPLGPGWVHRPERFAALSGLEQGDTLTWQALRRVLSSPQGGLKSTHSGMRRTALLNVASGPDNAAQLAQAQRLAGSLLPEFDAAALADLEQPQPVRAVFEPVAGVLLAAGSSLRLGRPKQLLDWQGETFVRRAARQALEAGLAPLVVVTGAHRKAVEAALAGLPVQLEYNPDWESGQGSSVALGTRSLPTHTGAVIFLVVDQPLVGPPLLRSLIDLHRTTLAPIVAPLVDDQRANPVLFDRSTFPDLAALQGDAGGRVLFSQHRAVWLPWHDRGPLLDVDTDQDYLHLLGEVD
jgi:molybdenum cofactor cytidylyltransferase